MQSIAVQAPVDAQAQPFPVLQTDACATIQQTLPEEPSLIAPPQDLGVMGGLQPAHSDAKKSYTAAEFRDQRAFQSNASYTGDVGRHVYGPGCAARSLAKPPGPRISESKIHDMKEMIAQGDNVHPYGSQSANQSDSRADMAVAKQQQSGAFNQPVPLPTNQKKHLDKQLDFLVDPKNQDQFRAISEGGYKQAIVQSGSSVRADSAGADSDASTNAGVNPVHRPLPDDPVIGNSITRGPVAQGSQGNTYTTTASGNRNYAPLQPETTNLASSVTGSTGGWGGGSSEGGGSGPADSTVVGVSESRGLVHEGPRGGTFTQTEAGNRNYSSVKD